MRESKTQYDTVFVFIVGGATYQEAAIIANLNATSQGTHFVLGGTTIHNSKSFVKGILTGESAKSNGGKRQEKDRVETIQI